MGSRRNQNQRSGGCSEGGGRWVRGAGQAIHSNCSNGGQPEAWVPHPYFRCPRAGGNGSRAGVMLPSPHPCPLVSQGGQGCRGARGSPPFTLPATPRCGEGVSPLCFRGRLREGESLCPKSRSTAGTRVLILDCPKSGQSWWSCAPQERRGITWGSGRKNQKLPLNTGSGC